VVFKCAGLAILDSPLAHWLIPKNSRRSAPSNSEERGTQAISQLCSEKLQDGVSFSLSIAVEALQPF
jgi:hypothetical protein